MIMKKLNLRVGIAAFSVLLIGLVTAALMTFNYADNENIDIATGSDAVFADASTSTVTTMIDRIIDNSNSPYAEDKDYHIVEITSGATSTLSQFISDGKFEDLIFNQHATDNTKKFNPDADITFASYNVNSIDSEATNAIKSADFIYITEDKSNKFSKTNDIPTDLVSILSNFAIGDYKPLVIDYTGGSGNNGGEIAGLTYVDLYKNVLKNQRRYSFSVKNGADVNEYIANQTEDLWLPIHGRDTSSNWVKTDDGKTIAKILTFTDDDTSFADSLRGVATKVTDAKVGGVEVASVYKFIEFSQSGLIYNSGEVRPEYIQFETASSGATLTELSSSDLSKYDLIIFDDSCEKKSIDKDTYLAIRSFENARGHIVYDSKLIATGSESGSQSGDINTDAQNFKTILSKASQSGKPAYSNIYVTNRADFQTLLTNVIPDVYDNNIVYIINNGSFRGLGGSGDTSSKFTLLEIEPAYPIDTLLAKYIKTNGNVKSAVYNNVMGNSSKYKTDGFYYLNTMNIINGLTADEISFDGGKSPLSLYDENSTATIQVPVEVELPTTHKEWVLQPSVFRNSGEVIIVDEATANDYRWWAGTIEGDAGDGYKYFKLTTSNYFPTYAQVDVHDTEIQVQDRTVTGLTAAGSNIQDYYAWKWSKAKLAYVTGKEYDEVEVVHMSSAEFNASLDSLNDTYDMIYIGGDNSAIKPVATWYLTSGNGNLPHEVYSNAGSYKTYAQFFKDWPSYNMYFTVGDTYKTPELYTDNNGNVINKSSIAANSGNDLTNKRFNELKAFADTGRPVIIGKDLYGAVTFDLNQSISLDGNNPASFAVLDNKIDPNSNMFKLVSSLISSGKSNIVSNFDFDAIYKADNTGKDYGNTIGDFVTVFRRTLVGDGSIDANADDVDNKAEGLIRDYEGNRVPNSTVKTSVNGVDCTNGNDVYKAFMTSSQRPKYIVESAPVLYSTGEFLSSHTLKFRVKLLESSPDSKARIYIDDNGDGKFTSDEKISKDYDLTKGSSVTVSANLKEDFTGPIFWKLEVYNTKNEKDSSSVTGVSAVKTNKKQPVNILQILPTESRGGVGSPDAHIFLCKDCQESLQVLTGNRLMGTNAYNHAMFHSEGARQFIFVQKQSTDDANIGNPGFGTDDQTPDIEEPTVEEDFGFVDAFNFRKYTTAAGTTNLQHGTNNYKQVGIHEHQFGFADIQNQAITGQTGYMEDFNLNLFDNASDMYDIRLTILTIDELNHLADTIPDYLNKATLDDYQNLSDKYYRYFTAMSDLLDGKAPGSYTADVSEILNTYDTFKTSLVDATKISTARNDLKKATEALANDYNGGVKYFTNDKGSPTQAEYKEIIENIAKHETYADLYFYNSGYASNKIGTYSNINKNFIVWRNAKVLETYFYNKYVYYQILASGGQLRKTITTANADSENKGAFGLVVLGAAEHFAKSGDSINQKATDMLVQYAKAEDNSKTDVAGDILLFHNTLTHSNANTYFSKKFRPLVGMDTSNERLANSARISNTTSKFNIANIELTDTYGNYAESHGNRGTYQQNYSMILWCDNNGFDGVDVSDPQFDAFKFYARGSKGDLMTDYAQCSSTTKGIMTSFPNSISNKIKISGTHQQTYTLDIPDENLTVWYSLAGGSEGTDGSILVADLNDHANNYYLYTYKNVTFFGAGHMYHTGLNKLNSEESKLIINAVLNSSRPSAMSDDTSVKLVTHSNKNYPLKEIDEESNEYKDYQYETTWSPDKLIDFEFGIQMKTDLAKGIYIKYVDIFFDFDYEPTSEDGHVYKAGTDKAVYGCEFDAKTGKRLAWQEVIKGITYDRESGDGIFGYDSEGKPVSFISSDGSTVYVDSEVYNKLFKNLAIDDSYFPDKYNNDYTYLCVRVTDSKGNVVVRTIKIKKAPFLFDIT